MTEFAFSVQGHGEGGKDTGEGGKRCWEGGRGHVRLFKEGRKAEISGAGVKSARRDSFTERTLWTATPVSYSFGGGWHRKRRTIHAERRGLW